VAPFPEFEDTGLVDVTAEDQLDGRSGDVADAATGVRRHEPVSRCGGELVGRRSQGFVGEQHDRSSGLMTRKELLQPAPLHLLGAETRAEQLGVDGHQRPGTHIG
jgi:hypothetical protein